MAKIVRVAWPIGQGLRFKVIWLFAFGVRSRGGYLVVRVAWPIGQGWFKVVLHHENSEG
ncbi:MAG: hypothetical protein F6J98_35385 [Moorea sp. SIO4G2]|uniref:hypothetical protein n=1 Tax=unclassified Moorena TaxID=2683338 RepID=UPI0013C0E4CA|nr:MULTISPECIES: hypothetical protein [unclassified Moorena]NEO09486.1 hypothetical protein [Moorena sp. SIO3I8]NEO21686.1 hypothetical protein [Moorena sp. SIO4A5]NEO65395.1 hypothetical protein [Moorena sp. SIO4G2]NEQ58335.1 hypothetical protein [Moorena sp. SIO4A1]